MSKRDKIPWIIAWIIGGLIFITWFFNLDYLWKGKESADSFITSIKEAISEVSGGFKDFSKAMQGGGQPGFSSPQDLEKGLPELKEKILEHVQGQITK